MTSCPPQLKPLDECGAGHTCRCSEAAMRWNSRCMTRMAKPICTPHHAASVSSPLAHPLCITSRRQACATSPASHCPMHAGFVTVTRMAKPICSPHHAACVSSPLAHPLCINSRQQACATSPASHGPMHADFGTVTGMHTILHHDAADPATLTYEAAAESGAVKGSWSTAR